MAHILGLDLGTNSIGWAIVEKEKGEEFKLIDKGVRIFQEGVKIEKGIESSKAAERTTFRSTRRLKYRRKLRKIAVLKVLSNYSYCPELSIKELNDWRYKKQYPTNYTFLNWQKTDEASQKNPYHYRALAVEKRFDLNNQEDRFKLGRAFYHMAQRRGFLSNRLESTPDNEKSTVKKAISEINKEKGEKTLGQYFYEKYKKAEQIRNTYTHREDHYLEEFNRICRFQQLPDDFCNQLRNAIFYQRPLKSQKSGIGKCVFEPNKHRCAVSRPEFEEYRMLCFINNIKVKTPDDEKLRELTADEKIKILPAFFRKSKEHFDFEDLAKLLAPKNQYKFYKVPEKFTEDWLFNYPMKTTVSGCPVSARFKELFGSEFLTDDYQFVKDSKDNLSKKVIDAWHALFTFDSEDKLNEFAKNTLGLDDQQTKKYVNIHLKQDYASLSLKAIRKITPFLKEGLIYSHAVFLANMSTAIPSDVWNNENDRKLIREEIHQLIKTQNEEKQLLEIVNGTIKTQKDEGAFWSNEARPLFIKEILQKTQSYYGAKRYASFDDNKKSGIEKRITTLFEQQMQKNNGSGEFAKPQTIDERVRNFLTDNFELDESKLNKLYHPSAIEVYKQPIKGEDGRLYLGSPMVSSIKNPMAMRAMHQLRKLVNELIKTDKIDASTKIHIEMARDLKNANERNALQAYQRIRENLRKQYTNRINEYFESQAIKTTATNDDIIKYELWEEQNHICLYTGESIGIEEFLGSNPAYDIEHTIPRSVSFDNSMTNKTLCKSDFNRSVKRNKIPYELKNYLEILQRIEQWKEKYEELTIQIEREKRKASTASDKEQKDFAIRKRHRLTFERDYWRNKYQRFTMEDVPEGFKNSQLIDTGIISKYSRLYLKTLFNKVYTVKGNTVADFRKMWGIQEEFEKKERTNHIHHCIDAIVIACITKDNYEELAHFYHQWEENHIAGSDEKPKVQKPWVSFSEKLKEIESEVLISHYTADVLPKQAKKIARKRGKKQYSNNGKPIVQRGDSARGSLHQQTFYGAIANDRNGNISTDKEGAIIPKYVIRKPLDSLEDANIKNIVDERVRTIVDTDRKREKELRKELDSLKKQLSNANEEDEESMQREINTLESEIKNLYFLPNKNGEPVPIKRVRVYANITNPLHFDKKQRDKSTKKRKPYKEEFNVANDSNYMMAIYEGTDAKGKTKRDFELINNLDAGACLKLSSRNLLNHQGIKNLNGLVPKQKTKGNVEMPLKSVLKIGTMVIPWKNDPDELNSLNCEELHKRLYKITSFENDGRIQLRYHQVAKQDKELKKASNINFISPEDKLRLSISKFNVLVEGIDFKLSVAGKLTWI